MDRLFDGLAAVVSRRPAVVLLSVFLLTGVFGFFSGQAQQEDGVSVDNELSAALETLDGTFSDPQSVLQVVIETTDGSDVRNTDALRASLDIQEAIRSSDLADTLIRGDQQPPIASFLGGAESAIAMSGMDPATLDDRGLRELQDEATAQLPPEVAGLFEGLIGEGDPPTAGLLLVFQRTDGLDETEATELQRELATLISEVEVADRLQVDPFSFGLLLTSGDPGPEIGRLFGTAFLIILVVLFFVYWIKPEAGQRLRIGRRTAADVGLTLVVIGLSVVWMQGLGVLLGPDYAGLISYFSPQTQIVPILIIGLGVDFAIHLLARYRAEVGGGRSPDAGFARSARTVGLTLLLCTAATAIGFLTNLASPVDFLATLGVLAATGIAAAFVLTMTFLPAVRLLLDRRAAAKGVLPVQSLGTQKDATLPRVIGRTAWLAERVPVQTLAVGTLLVVLGGYGFTQLDSEFNLTDFVPQDEPLLEVFDTISTDFGGGFEETTEVLLRGDLATVEAHNALVDALARSADVTSVETLGGQADATSIVSVLGQALGTEGLADRLGELGVQPDLTVAEGSDVAAIYELLLAEVEAAPSVLALQDGEALGRISLRTSASQAGAAELADDLATAFAPVEDAGIEAVPVSQQILQARIGADIEASQISSLLIALGAAMLLLVIHFAIANRRPLVGVITVLPVGLVLALTFGTMALTGIPLNPVTATLAALSIGIGVPFTIHVTSRFLEERRVLYDGMTALRRTVSQTGGALAGSALTTAIGFGVLVTSTLVPFEQLGYVIVYAIIYSVVASILILPSMLALWDGFDRGRHGNPAAGRLEAPEPTEAPVG
ncbi:MAG: efflux RND transporter permease subunit [Nitriliruptoraceae bacterium]